MFIFKFAVKRIDLLSVYLRSSRFNNFRIIAQIMSILQRSSFIPQDNYFIECSHSGAWRLRTCVRGRRISQPGSCYTHAPLGLYCQPVYAPLSEHHTYHETSFVHTPEEYEANRRVSLGFILDANHPNVSDDSMILFTVTKSNP